MDRLRSWVHLVAAVVPLVVCSCTSPYEVVPKAVRGDLSPLQVWGTSLTDLFAIGEGGLILHHDGKAWSRMESATTVILGDIIGTAPNDVYVVGPAGTILHFDGHAWKPVETGVKSDLCGIWAASENDVFAVGDKGVVLHYDGKTWQHMSTGIDDILCAVWGSSGTDVFAVGDGGTILHYDGQSWHASASPVKVHLRDISGVSKSRVYAVGGEGTVIGFDGGAWKVLMQKDPKSRWNGVCAFPDGEIRVVGWDSKTGGIMMWYDGKSWGDCRTSSSVGNWSELNSVWGLSSKNFFFVGIDGIRHHSRS